MDDTHESYFKSVEGALGFERSELSYKFEMQEKMIEMVEVSIVFFMFGSLNFPFSIVNVYCPHFTHFVTISRIRAICLSL